MIEIRNISKIYEYEKVVDNLSIKVENSTIFGFLGPNGSGKTTTMKMLVGLTRPSEGEIRIDGKLPTDISARDNIGFMPEEPHFYDYLTGREFLEFAYNLFDRKKKKSEQEFDDVLKKAGIFDAKNRMIRTYSKGMKQRLGFAQALINDPEYIFLDEPLEGLDPIGRRELKNTILQLKDRKKTIFFNSHILSDIENICDEIGIIYMGKLIYSGPVQEFKGQGNLEDKFIAAIAKLAGRESVIWIPLEVALAGSWFVTKINYVAC